MKRRGFFRTLIGLPLAIPILAEATKAAEVALEVSKFQEAVTLYDRVGGGVLYVKSGVLAFRGSGGAFTEIVGA